MAQRHRGEADELSALIGTIYDAALDPALWPDAIAGTCRFLDCRFGVLGAADLLRSAYNFLVPWGYEQRDWQNYVDHYFHKNPLNLVAFRSNTGDVIARARLDEEWKRLLESDFCKEWAKPLGIVDGIQATLDKTASGLVTLTCARHERAGVAGPRELRRMRPVFPHFRRSVLISKALDLRSLHTSAFAEVIDGLTTGVFLVSPQSELVHANASGQAMLDAGDPLTLVRGILAASDGGVQASLQRAFAGAPQRDAAISSGGIALPLVRKAGRRFIAHVLPLGAGARRSTGDYYSAAAMLFVREAEIDLPAAINAAARLYRFTPAEERVLRALIEVGGISPVAAMLGASRSTVKRHIEHLFEKTGAKRQADLVKLIAGLDSPARRHAQLS